MINLVSLQNAFKNFFNNYPTTLLKTNPTQQGNIYELYLYTVVCGSIGYVHPTNLKPGNEFYIRQTPGGLNKNFGYFEGVSPKGNIIQIHNDVQFIGISGMLHEIDISAIEVSNTITLPPPTRNILKLALECKSHESANALKGESRSFVGLMMDLSNISPIPPGGCVLHGQGFYSALVTNVAHGRKDIISYLTTYRMNFRYNIIPGSIEEAAFKQEIANLAQTW